MHRHLFTFGDFVPPFLSAFAFFLFLFADDVIPTEWFGCLFFIGFFLTLSGLTGADLILSRISSGSTRTSRSKNSGIDMFRSILSFEIRPTFNSRCLQPAFYETLYWLPG